MTLFDSIILGIVEGVAEFLPISSTGHLVLASTLLGLEQTEFLKTFEIAIQLGAIVAVVVLFWQKLWDGEVIKRLIVGFVPAGIIGLLLYRFVKTYLLGNEGVVLWALFLGGIFLIAFEYWHEEKDTRPQDIRTIPYRTVAIIGLFQALAIIPGVSRSAATIVGGLLLGLRRHTIVEFSFLLAVPTMLAATGLDIVQSAASISLREFGLLFVGFVVAFIVAMGSITWLLRYVRNHTFVPFGIYRIVLALLFWFFIIR